MSVQVGTLKTKKQSIKEATTLHSCYYRRPQAKPLQVGRNMHRCRVSCVNQGEVQQGLHLYGINSPILWNFTTNRMKRLLLLLTASIIVASCTKTSQNRAIESFAPLETRSEASHDTLSSTKAELRKAEEPQTSNQEKDKNNSFTSSQADSIKKKLVPPVETPGKGYDGRLPKDSTLRAEMLKQQEFRRKQDSLWRLEALKKKSE